MSTFEQQFIEFCINSKVLRFGEFKTKAGRLSPYFFNAGLFNSGSQMATLADFYARALKKALEEGSLEFDMLFGPAYKGISLVVATAIKLSEFGIDVPFCFNRKETKDHGEGGNMIGAPLKGKVVILDDVISAGTSIKESVNLIKQQGATPAGVLIALDRKERGGTATEISQHSANEEVSMTFKIPVLSIVTLEDLLAYVKLSEDRTLKNYETAIATYRQKYGV